MVHGKGDKKKGRARSPFYLFKNAHDLFVPFDLEEHFCLYTGRSNNPFFFEKKSTSILLESSLHAACSHGSQLPFRPRKASGFTLLRNRMDGDAATLPGRSPSDAVDACMVPSHATLPEPPPSGGSGVDGPDDGHVALQNPPTPPTSPTHFPPSLSLLPSRSRAHRLVFSLLRSLDFSLSPLIRSASASPFHTCASCSSWSLVSSSSSRFDFLFFSSLFRGGEGRGGRVSVVWLGGWWGRS